MALVRLRDIRDPVELHVDGERIVAERGDPIAAAIGSSGRMVLSRSVKYHRPRGAVCYRGSCDGCAMRIDGHQSVPSCQRRVEGVHECETQNAFGSAEADLLAATDWFFPSGLDHHHMFTRFGPVNRLMQKIARRIAGVGKLPDEVRPVTDMHQRSVDVLVVGGGYAGLVAAAACAQVGLQTLLVHEHDRWEHESELAEARAAGAEVLAGHAALGIYEKEALVMGAAGCLLVRANAFVFATGTHEGVPAVRGADHPGVIDSEAARVLLREGFAPGRSIVLGSDGSTSSQQLLDTLSQTPAACREVPAGTIARIRGGNQVEAVLLKDGTTLQADAVVMCGIASAAYELPVQSGAACTFDGRAFWVVTDEKHRCTAHDFALGSCTGQWNPAEVAQSAKLIARSLKDRSRA